MEIDINKIIQEQTNLYSERIKKNTSFKSNERIAASAGFARGATIVSEIILSKWQESERWRKVSEELPEVSNYKDLKCDFLAKTDYGYDIVTYYNDPKFLVGWFANAIRRNVIEWKPIS